MKPDVARRGLRGAHSRAFVAAVKGRSTDRPIDRSTDRDRRPRSRSRPPDRVATDDDDDGGVDDVLDVCHANRGEAATAPGDDDACGD